METVQDYFAQWADTERFWSLLAATLLTVGIGIMSWYRSRAAKTGDEIRLDEEGIFIMVALRIFGGLLWCSALVYCTFPALLSWSSLSLPVWLRYSGLLIGVFNIGFLVWTFRSIGSNITTTVAIKKEHQLVTSGIYAWVRHPLYTFGGGFFLGMALLSANWFILLSLAGTMTLLLSRLPNEERRLIETFGDDYRFYQQRVGALLPRFTGNHPAAWKAGKGSN